MLRQLMGKEIKYQLKNITLYLFFAVLIIFYSTQFSPPSEKDNLQPVPPSVKNSLGSSSNWQSYGVIAIKNPEEEIKLIYNLMIMDFQTGEIIKYGLLLNKQVRLSEEQKGALKEAMEKIAPEGFENNQNLQITVSYNEYLKIIRELDQRLGGSTNYSDKYRKTNLYREMTYPEALASFHEILSKDKLTDAYGRLFADYMGITAGILPIFLAAFLLTRERRIKMHELIYSRPVSSFKYVIAKYLALNILIYLGYLLIATHATFIFYIIAKNNNYPINLLAFYKYTTIWVMPTVLFTTAIGMFVSVLFGNGIAAIPIQFFLWITSLMPLKGEYGYSKFIIRFNELGFYEEYINWLGAIQSNRIFYTFLSIGIIILTSWIWAWKRGAIDGFNFKYFKNRSV